MPNKNKDQENARLFGIRRRKLDLLVSEVGSQSLVAQRLATSHMTSLHDTSYISRALSGKSRKDGGKNIGGDAASEIERIMGKAAGWLSRDEGEPTLLVDGALWDQLSPNERDSLTTTVNAMVKGFLSDQKKRSRKAS